MATSKLENVKHELREVILSTTTEKLERLIQNFEKEINYGLSADEQVRRKTGMLMVKTFIGECDPTLIVPGRYLGVDLGSTNVRVVLADLTNPTEPKFDCEGENIRRFLNQPIRKLFDHIAAKISDFLTKKDLEKEHLKLGFTFSFPVVQESIKCAKLVEWISTFSCSDGIGEDAVKLLQEAINQRGDCNVEVTCVINDTTGALMAGIVTDPKCAIGAIVGSGFNLAYYEKTERLKWFADAHFPSGTSPKMMVINTECAIFGDDGCLDFMKTKYDDQIDMNSSCPKLMTFEKNCSGFFFGEFCRIVLHDLAKKGLFLNAGGHDKLATPCDKEDGDFVATRAVLDKLGLLPLADEEDIKVLHFVCRAMTKRAADRLAVMIAALVRHMGLPDVAVAMDGSFYRCQPGLAEYMQERVNALCPDSKVRLVMVQDGSGRGAALAAALVNKQA